MSIQYKMNYVIKVLILLAVVLAVPFALVCLLVWFDPDTREGAFTALSCFSVIFAIIYSSGRVFVYHPYARKKYREWLAWTPWTYGKPLPLGTFHPKWGDLFVLVVLAGYAMLCLYIATDWNPDSLMSVESWMIVPGVFAAAILAYLISLFMTIGDDPVTTQTVWALLPLSFYPHQNPWIAAGVLTVIYIVIRIGIRRTLGKFPWNRDDWNDTSRQAFLRKLAHSGLIGWPYRQIGPELPEGNKTTILQTLVYSLISAWWMFVIFHLVEMRFMAELETNGLTIQDLTNSTDHQGVNLEGMLNFFKWCVLVAAIFASLNKVILFISGARPPINLRGRIMTRRLIIPGYDKLFVVPILNVLLTWALVELLLYVNIRPLALSPAICLFTILFLLMLPYPSTKQWRYTGHFSIGIRGGPSQSESAQRARAQQVQIRLPGCN